MIAQLARPLAIAAALGWLIAVTLSLAGFAGAALPPWVTIATFISMFALFVCAIALTQATKGAWRSEPRNALWRLTPIWFRCAVLGAWLYSLAMIGLMRTDANAAVVGLSGFFFALSFGIFMFAKPPGEHA